jgi:hypothetical protein
MTEQMPSPTPSSDPGASPEAPRKRSFWAKLLKFPRSWKEVKQQGWRFIALFILFYLIRDLILYVLIPWLVYEGFWGK